MRLMYSICFLAMLGFAQSPHVAFLPGGYVGVGMREVTGGGVEITSVVPESPAEKAGLKAGDVLLKYDGQKVEGNEQFARMVSETPVPRDVKVEIYRGGAAQTVTVRVEPRKAPPMARNTIPIVMNFDMPRPFIALRSGGLGIEAEAIDGQLAQYFGVKEGVLVRSVIKGSAAEKAALRAGDVIVKIDDAKVANPMDISMHLGALHGKTTQIGLMRDHKEMTVSVMLSDEMQMTPMEIHPR
jgi:serine protease Do